jgi:hypothetical protein
MSPDYLPSSDTLRDERRSEGDLAPLQTVARHLIAAIAAEPLPERLRDLATELGRALDNSGKKE